MRIRGILQDEVISLETEIMECWALVTTNAHDRAV